MTTKKASELERVKDREESEKQKSKLLTFNGALRDMLRAQTRALTGVTFPSSKYRADPVAFFREVLGVEPWHKQIEIIEAIRDHKRVTVKSGHKVSKSHTASGIALWFYCSYSDARVVMTSTTDRQVNDILWRETRIMLKRSGLCVKCKAENKRRETLRSNGVHAPEIEKPCIHSAEIDGEIGDLARTGLKSEDFREIKGFTAREAEAVAGISGANLLYILDEASGIKAEIFEAIEGNRAGGARIAMFSNPTKTSGDFYDSHNSKADFYSCHTISSEETPNALYGDEDPRAIPGLAGKEWIEEKKKEWGEDSPMYKVRVKGEFAELEAGKIFSIHDIAESEARNPTTPASGRLYIGLDPAGDGPTADEIVWAPRRGLKQLPMLVKRSINEESILMHTLGLCRELRDADKREIPVLVMDREGMIGAKVYGHFLAFLSGKEEPPFELVGIRASDRAHRNPIVFDRMRDELVGAFNAWVREGGAIVTDPKLAKEMHVFEWLEQISGRVKVTPKKEVKRELGRSPDRFDALTLSTWEPLHIREGKVPRKDTVDSRPNVQPMDPYAGSDQWAGGR